MSYVHFGRLSGRESTTLSCIFNDKGYRAEDVEGKVLKKKREFDAGPSHGFQGKGKL